MIVGLISGVLLVYFLYAFSLLAQAGWRYRWGTLANVFAAGTIFIASFYVPNAWWMSLALLPLLLECAAAAGENQATAQLLFSLNVPQFLKAAKLAHLFRWDGRRQLWAIRMQSAQHLLDGDPLTATVLIDRGFNSQLPRSEALLNEIVALTAERLTLNYEAITARCRRMQDLDPNNRSAYAFYFIAAIAYLNRGYYEHAYDELRAIRQFVPRQFLDLYSLNFLSEFDCPGLDKALRRRSVPTFCRDFFWGIALRSRGNAEEARTLFENAIQKLPNGEPVYDGWKMRIEQQLGSLESQPNLPAIDRSKHAEKFERRLVEMGSIRNLLNRQPTRYDLLVPSEQCAPRMTRIAATSIDFAFVAILPFLAALVFLVNPALNGTTLWYASMICTALVALFYGPMFESSSWGATPGKRLMGLKTATITGEKLSFFNGLGKQFATLVVLPMTWLLIVPLTVLSCFFLSGPHKQTVQDKLFNRVVLVEERKSLAKRAFIISSVSWAFILATWFLLAISAAPR